MRLVLVDGLANVALGVEIGHTMVAAA